MYDENCIFCKIAQGEAPSHNIWEDDNHLAFLNIYPNTVGTSLVIPKKHYTSYFAELPEQVLIDLMLATKKVALLLDKSFEDVGRTAMVFEGFGVNHIHSKLYPMHGTSLEDWRPIEADIDLFFDEYPGYVSSHSAKRASDEELAKIAKKIRSN